jgi:hypothetical protein
MQSNPSLVPTPLYQSAGHQMAYNRSVVGRTTQQPVDAAAQASGHPRASAWRSQHLLPRGPNGEQSATTTPSDGEREVVVGRQIMSPRAMRDWDLEPQQGTMAVQGPYVPGSPTGYG